MVKIKIDLKESKAIGLSTVGLEDDSDEASDSEN